MPAWRARPRTSIATRASGTNAARSPRSRSGGATRARECRLRSSRKHPIGVGSPDVDGLDELCGAEVPREQCVEARVWKVRVAVVGRHFGAGALEVLAV